MGVELRDGPDDKDGTDAIYEGVMRWEGCEKNCALFFEDGSFDKSFDKFLHSPRPKIDMTGVKFGAGDRVVFKDGKKGLINFFGRDPRYRMFLKIFILLAFECLFLFFFFVFCFCLAWYEPLIGCVLAPAHKPDDKIGSDGTWHGKRYFTCEPGRGIFVTIDNWTKIFKAFEQPKKEEKEKFVEKRRKSVLEKLTKPEPTEKEEDEKEQQKEQPKVTQENYVECCKNWKLGDWILFGDGSKGKIVAIEQKESVWIIHFEKSDGQKIKVNNENFDKQFGGIVKNETSPGKYVPFC